jgi:hypothetical protein
MGLSRLFWEQGECADGEKFFYCQLLVSSAWKSVLYSTQILYTVSLYTVSSLCSLYTVSSLCI